MRKLVRQTRTRELRQHSTDAEQLLWRHLRNRNLGGFKFRRQVALGALIADFVCIEQRLVIQLDGGQHLDATAEDIARTRYFERGGYRVLRYWKRSGLARNRSRA